MRLFISRPQYRLSVSSRKIYDERNEIERRRGGIVFRMQAFSSTVAQKKEKNVRGGRGTNENEQTMTRMFLPRCCRKKKKEKIAIFIDDSIKLNFISDIASSTINRV